MSNQEQDIRVEILNTLLTTPHRALDKIWPVHSELIQKDPRFYVRLAAWYADNGDVRDHKEMFVINLVLSEFPGHRDVGLAMLRNLPPYQVGRVVDFISGRKRTRKSKGETSAPLTAKTRRLAARQALGTANVATKVAPKTEASTTVVESFGLFRNVPRAMKTEITRYLREREADPDWFDGSVLTARKAMKRMYALLHVRPNQRAQKILFENDPPVGSRLYALRALAKADNPAAQAQAIVDNKIPYRVASTVIKQMTPTVLVALISQMSSQELINSLAALKRRGVLEMPEVKALIESKLTKAQSADRVSALKTGMAIEAANLSGDVRKAVEDVADRQIKAKGRITRPTALLVDKSASMSTAIELGKRIGSMISTICEADLFTYAFDTMAHQITSEGDELSDWEKAFKGISAGSATSCGVAIKNLEKKKQYVEQIIMITDEGENTPPQFVKSIQEYRQAMDADPAIVLVRTPGGANYLEQQCQRAGIMVDVFKFAGDYYSLPNLIPMLSRPNKLELLMEIMDYELPKRKA